MLNKNERGEFNRGWRHVAEPRKSCVSLNSTMVSEKNIPWSNLYFSRITSLSFNFCPKKFSYPKLPNPPTPITKITIANPKPKAEEDPKPNPVQKKASIGQNRLPPRALHEAPVHRNPPRRSLLKSRPPRSDPIPCRLWSTTNSSPDLIPG